MNMRQHYPRPDPPDNWKEQLEGVLVVIILIVLAVIGIHWTFTQ